MMVNKMKFYAVKVGKTPGVYETWDECSKQVVGFQGAVYKSFPTKEEAIEFVTGKKIEHKDNFKNPTAYVDGSFNVLTNEYSFGAILFVDNKKLTFKKKFEAIIEKTTKIKKCYFCNENSNIILLLCDNFHIFEFTIDREYISHIY
jgi:viroplasmin and RNaseH domain-containing protein